VRLKNGSTMVAELTAALQFVIFLALPAVAGFSAFWRGRCM
jgi:hypothetical protein